MEKGARDLAEAAAKGHVKKVEALVRAGVNINSKGFHGLTPLFLAILAQNKAGVEQLLGWVRLPIYLLRMGEPNPYCCPLLKDPVFLKLLLAHGANPNVLRDSDGKSPLHLAILSVEAYRSEEKIQLPAL